MIIMLFSLDAYKGIVTLCLSILAYDGALTLCIICMRSFFLTVLLPCGLFSGGSTGGWGPCPPLNACPPQWDPILTFYIRSNGGPAVLMIGGGGHENAQKLFRACNRVGDVLFYSSTLFAWKWGLGPHILESCPLHCFSALILRN